SLAKKARGECIANARIGKMAIGNVCAKPTWDSPAGIAELTRRRGRGSGGGWLWISVAGADHPSEPPRRVVCRGANEAGRGNLSVRAAGVAGAHQVSAL